MDNVDFKQDKFHELVIHVADKCRNNHHVNVDAMGKLLYYMDFGSYRLLGNPITGATYCHMPSGPEPVQLPDTRKYLESQGDARVEIRDHFSGRRSVMVPLRQADTSKFSQQELAVVDAVIDEFWHYNNRQLSDYACGEFGWKATDDMEVIPYYTAWVSSDPLTPEQVHRGIELANSRTNEVVHLAVGRDSHGVVTACGPWDPSLAVHTTYLLKNTTCEQCLRNPMYNTQ